MVQAASGIPHGVPGRFALHGTHNVSDRHDIVVADVDPMVASSLSRLLGTYDRTVRVVGSADETREAILSRAPSLLILGLPLGAEETRSLLVEIRGAEATALLPVIVISDQRALQDECLALGADAFIPKPLAYPVLRDHVQRQLARRVRWGLTPDLDPLTGLPSRTVGLIQLRRLEHGLGPGRRAFVALVAPDRLSQLNQRFGRTFGDSVLMTLAEALRTELPQSLIFRWTGAEILVTFAAQDLPAAEAKVEEAARRIGERRVDSPRGERVRISVSAGLVELQKDGNLDAVLAQVQEHLYAAARRGPGLVRSGRGSGSGGGHILVAEDDEVTATVIKHRLAKAGFTVEHYDNGSDAYAAAKRTTANLIISDIKMPGLDGFELVRRLRQHPDYMDVPIILLSTMNRETDIVRGLGLGANDYVVKPFSPQELQARVERLLGLEVGYRGSE